ncbi:MAG: tyrosine-protein phosphatase [Eubacteriales bacterium]
MPYADIHCHLLPGLDDGSSCMEETLDMARLALDSGVTTIAVTPHSYGHGYSSFDPDCCFLMRHRLEALREMLAEYRLPLKVVPGMEILAHEKMTDYLRDGLMLTLNDTRYVLVEFPFDEHPRYVRKMLDELLSEGYRPIVAHPERYFFVQDRPDLVAEWLEAGALAQANKGSPLGYFGSSAKKCADYLLSCGMIQVIASDAHSADYRTTHFGAISAYITKHYSPEIAKRLLDTNPRAILHGSPVKP